MKINSQKATSLISKLASKGNKVASLMLGEILMSSSIDDSILKVYFLKSLNKGIFEAKLVLHRFNYGNQIQDFQDLFDQNHIGAQFWFAFYSFHFEIYQSVRIDHQQIFENILKSNESFWIDQIILLNQNSSFSI